MAREGEPGLRERTRLAVRREIAAAAEALFLERGYHATTINDVAEAVNMSPRSLFRYFATKEDILLEKLDKVVEEMIEALRRSALEVPVWVSLRRMFDGMIAHATGSDSFTVVEPIQRIVLETPAMLGRYLIRLQAFQDEVAEILRERAAARSQAFAADDPTPEALAGAAVSCLVTAQRRWLALEGRTGLDEVLDQAMQAVHAIGAD
jgi:AcrR family transcriptional regulator